MEDKNGSSSMTKHRKILEGVSDGPWYKHRRYKVITNDAGAALPFYSDFEFIIHARNHWESICDLIDAVESYRDANTPHKVTKAIPAIYAALDKLNEG